MQHISNTLNRLATIFNVEDIMIPLSEMVVAGNIEEAQEQQQLHPEFDIIPIVNNRKLEGYIHKFSNRYHHLATEDLISKGTSIFKLINILTKRDFSFVLSENIIVGYVHYSDLNNQLVKIPLYVLFEALESDIIQTIGDKIDEGVIKKVIPNKAENHIKNIERRRKNNVDVSLANFLYLSEYLKIASYLGHYHLTDNEIIKINKYRNRVDHADHALIGKRTDIIEINEVRLLCLELLGQKSGMSKTENLI